MARGFAFSEGVLEQAFAKAKRGLFDESWITEEL